MQEMESLSGGPMAELLRFPYTLGTGLSLGAAVLSIPMCFHINTALWFNEHFVTFEALVDVHLVGHVHTHYSL